MRLFIALPLPGMIEEELRRCIAKLRTYHGNIKWVNPKNIHLTLKFLGETNESQVDALSKAISKTTIKHDVIKTTLESVSAFPNLRRPKVIFAALDGGIQKLTALANEIDQATSKLGFKSESRPFKPHLSLGRVKDSLGLEKTTEALQKIRIQRTSFAYDKIVLYQSTLTPQGAIYEKLFSVKLGEDKFGD